MEEQYKIPTKEDLTTTPKDTVQEGVITAIEAMTWKEKLTPEQLIKFKANNNYEPGDENTPIVLLSYKTDEGHKGQVTFRWYDKPSDKSNIGKALAKYGSLEPGTRIKTIFNDKGFGELHL